MKFTPQIEFYFDLDVRDKDKAPKTLKEAVVNEILQRVGVLPKQEPVNLKEYEGQEIESPEFINYNDAMKNRELYFGNKRRNSKSNKTRRK